MLTGVNVDRDKLMSILKRLENPEQTPKPAFRLRGDTRSTGFRRDGKLLFSPEGEVVTSANIHRMPGAYSAIFEARLAKQNPSTLVKPIGNPPLGNPTSLKTVGNPSTNNSTDSYWELINNPETPLEVKPLVPSKGYNPAILSQKFVNYLLQRGVI
jgi:hypothetical protein